MMTRLFPIVFLIVGIIPTTTFSVAQVLPSHELESVISAHVPQPVDPDSQRLNELAEKFPHSRLQRRFQSTGSTRYLIQHHEQPLKITAFDRGEFEVRLTREFSADDIDGLADNHPELLKHAESFPRTTDANTKVTVKIETEVTYRFDNELEFETEHPELFEIYREFKSAPIPTDVPSLITRVASKSL